MTMRSHPMTAIPRRLRRVGLLLLGTGTFLVPASLLAHRQVEFADVQPIISRNCGGNGCHINEKTSGVELTTYEDVMTSVGQQFGRPIVFPGRPDSSPLIDKIEKDSPEYGTRMPFGGKKLDPRDIALLRQWVRDGAIESHIPQRGDADGDDDVNITDALRILGFLFLGAQEPFCAAVADTDADESVNLTDAVFLLNFLFLGGDRPAPLTEDEAESCEVANDLSFDSIYEKVFSVSCAFSSCHDSEDPKAELSLASRDEAYENLFQVAPSNDAAREAGLLRVDPGSPENSFLYRKLTQPGPGEGNRMPANSPDPLSDATIGAIREWIRVGAPLGRVAGVPDITDDPPPPIDRLSPPPAPDNGVQLHVPPFEIGPRRERQLHYFGGAPFSGMDREDIWVKRIDIHMLEQSHHFILYDWVAPFTPPTWREGSDIDIERVRTIVVSQQSFFSLAFPEGIGIRFRREQRFDLNSHYINLNGERTLLGEVYVNIFFAEPGEITTEAKPIFDFGGSILVPPNRTTTATGLFPNAVQTRAMDPSLAAVNGRVNRETHILALTTHMHRHGDRFEVFRSGGAGEKVHDNFSWDDPLFEVYDPPLVLQPGEGLRYVATYTYHDPPSPSAPPLTWGPTSEDEMIILLGYYAVP